MAKTGVKSFRTPEYETLIATLVSARERAGLRHDELARKLGHSRTYIYSVEHFGRRVDPAEVRLIAQALGVDPLDLFKEWLRNAG